MKKELSLESFIQQSKQGKRVAVFKTYAADCVTPIVAYQALAEDKDGSVLLESCESYQSLGHYSFIGLRPFIQMRSKGNRCHLEIKGCSSHVERHPIDLLKDLLDQHSSLSHPDLPPYVGGAIGSIAYDAVRLFEQIPDRHHDPDGNPEIAILFHEAGIVFQHRKGTMTVCLCVKPGHDPAKDYFQAMAEIESLAATIKRFKASQSESIKIREDETVDISDAEFCQMVEKAKEHIIAGDAFQIVLSRCFKKPYSGTALELYRALRYVNPSPFMFLINNKDLAFAGASPELLVSVKAGVMETMPIAGTRPRGKGHEDLALEQDLLNDKKELAEHMMLVDLARNDLGSVAEIGSIEIKDFKSVHRFSHVMHIVSRVQGTLKEGKHSLDAFKAVFPAGTISGAPKIRAMEIIDGLETSKRHLYGGAIIAVDAKGDLESCIAIRMISLHKGMAAVRTGAGIVYDSDPQKEADETRHKARGVLEAIKMAEEGLI